MRDFTFIIKTFLRPRCVNRLINSIRDLGYIEPIIVVDDSGPNARPPAALDPERYGDIFVPLPFDSGLSTGRNAALERVETPFFVLLDDDFIFDKRTRVDLLVTAAAADGFDIVAGALEEDGKIRHYEGDLALNDGTLRYIEVRRPVGEEIPRFDLVFNFFAGRTDAVRRVRWDPDLKLAEHTDFFLRAKGEGLRVGYFPEVIVQHRPERPAGYEELRKRGNVFFKAFMRKHKIRRVVNFNGDEMKAPAAGMEALVKTYERPECVERLVMSIAKYAPHLQLTIGDDSRKFNATRYRDLWDRAMRAGLKNKPTALNLGHDIGLAAGRNRLIDASKAEYLLFLDDDFVFTAETDLTKLRDVLDASPEIGVAAGKLRNEDGSAFEFEGGILYDPMKRLIAIRKSEPEWYSVNGVSFRTFDIVPNFALIRREVFDTVRWDEAFKINGEHTDFFLTLKREGRWKVASVPACLAVHAQRFPDDYKPQRKREEFLRRLFTKYEVDEIHIFAHGMKPDPDDPAAVIRYRVINF